MVLLCVTVLLLISWFYVYSKNKYNFWAQRGVKGPKPLPLVGNYGAVFTMKESVEKLLHDVYEQFPDEKIVGVYRGLTPVLLVRDPELIKQILIKDFPLFQNRDSIFSKSRLGKNLLPSNGDTWKVLRQKLTPLLTVKKLKDMIPLVEQCVTNYMSFLETSTANKVDHEITSLKSKYTLQVIGACAFDLQLNTFKDQEDEFSVMARKIFNPSIVTEVVDLVDVIVPGVKKMVNLTSDMENFFLDLVSKVVKQRANDPTKRKDFMDLMIDLKEQRNVGRFTEQGKSGIVFDDVLVAAQTFIFFAAGFETSSATMSLMVHELALNQDIQKKVYEEICNVSAKHDGKINYESIKEMSYLKMVFDETLRTHSVANLLNRKASTDYILPGTDVSIPKGTPVFVSLSALHKDEKYYEQPEEFDPERFSEENNAKRPNYTYLPYGVGPRSCIGIRFTTIQSLMAVASFLKKFRVEPSSKTKTLDKVSSYSSYSRDGIWVKILKR